MIENLLLLGALDGATEIHKHHLLENAVEYNCAPLVKGVLDTGFDLKTEQHLTFYHKIKLLEKCLKKSSKTIFLLLLHAIDDPTICSNQTYLLYLAQHFDYSEETFDALFNYDMAMKAAISDAISTLKSISSKTGSRLRRDHLRGSDHRLAKLVYAKHGESVKDIFKQYKKSHSLGVIFYIIYFSKKKWRLSHSRVRWKTH
jgi:hypothetical protein